jgi:hypothetical protein
VGKPPAHLPRDLRDEQVRQLDRLIADLRDRA